MYRYGKAERPTAAYPFRGTAALKSLTPLAHYAAPGAAYTVPTI